MGGTLESPAVRGAARNQMETRILHYVDSDVFGGTERSLLQLVEGLGQRGYLCSIRCHEEPGLARLREEAGAKRLSLRQVPRPSGWRTPSVLWGLAREFHEFHPAIVHVHMPSVLGCRDAIAAATLARVPVVIATVQLWIPQPQNALVHIKQRLLARFVDRYVAVSHAVAAQLSGKFRVPREKIRVVSNGTVIPPRSARSSSTPRGRVQVLTTCRLHPQKGLDTLLHAVSRVPDAVLLIAGDGPERQRLQDLARRLCIADRVRFLGFRNDVSRLLDACDLFVLPSLYEGLPLALLEAMAHEKPIVATAVAGNEEALADGAGILVPPRDPDALAAAITALASDPGRARSLAAAGHARVQANFSVERMVDGIVRVYADALGASALAP
jgi:glycosyltransferase involved in cell wall biosynthesis